MLPSKTTLMTIGWTLATLAVIYRVRQTRNLLTG
jgi:hypothetical protein